MSSVEGVVAAVGVTATNSLSDPMDTLEDVSSSRGVRPGSSRIEGVAAIDGGGIGGGDTSSDGSLLGDCDDCWRSRCCCCCCGTWKMQTIGLSEGASDSRTSCRPPFASAIGMYKRWSGVEVSETGVSGMSVVASRRRARASRLRSDTASGATELPAIKVSEVVPRSDSRSVELGEVAVIEVELEESSSSVVVVAGCGSTSITCTAASVDDCCTADDDGGGGGGVEVEEDSGCSALAAIAAVDGISVAPASNEGDKGMSSSGLRSLGAGVVATSSAPVEEEDEDESSSLALSCFFFCFFFCFLARERS